jgi:hypothetical protein
MPVNQPRDGTPGRADINPTPIMKFLLPLLVVLPFTGYAAEAPPAKPVPQISPGRVTIPLEKMRRIWGELISLDLHNRTGTFRNESNEEIMHFTVMPYAELLHHATLGDLQDFKVGERAIFRLHVDEKEQWVWLTYIQDEMNMMNGHREYFHVDAIDTAAGKLTCKWANADLSFIRDPAVTLETDKDTRYWKHGLPAKFSDIQPGDKLRTKTHGTGSGKHRVPWEVFLDDESLSLFQSEQKGVHAARMKEQGAPGYVDEVTGTELKMTIFNEADTYIQPLKQGMRVRVAAAGVDRKPLMPPVEAVIVETGKRKGERQTFAVLKLDTTGTSFEPTKLARLWLNAP